MFAPPYRAAVIGRTGRGDYGHGLDLAVLDLPKLQVVAVADDDAEGLAKAAQRLGGIKPYRDYRVMLREEKPEFVVVGPRWLDGHKEMILECADHGVRGVFCEKPLAPDLASCDAIVDACDRSHMKLAMAFQTRYSPKLAKIQKMIADGAIGEVLELRGRGKEDARGGGEDLMVLGVHILNLCNALLGEPSWCFARVSEHGEPIGPKEVRQGAEGIDPLAGDRVDAMFGFSGSPAVAHFETSRPKEPGRRFGLTIFGSKGCIRMATGWMPPAFLLSDPTWAATDSARWTPITVDGVDEKNDAHLGNRAIVSDLIHAVETDTQPLTDARAGRTPVEMIMACYASQAKNAMVKMPLEGRTEHPLKSI